MFDGLGAAMLRRWARVALIAAIVTVVVYVIVAAWRVLVPFLLGLIVAWIFLPAINGLERRLPQPWQRRGIARLIAILVVYGAVLGLVILFLIYFVPRVIQQTLGLIASAPAIYRSLQSSLAGLRQWYETNVPQSVRAFIQQQVPSTPEAWLAILERAIVSAVTGIVRNTLPVLFGYVVVPFWLIYVIYDSERLKRAVLSLFPEGALPDVYSIGRILNEVAAAYLRGQIFVAASIGFLTGLALYLLGVDFPIVLGVIAAIGDLIPTFGPVIAAIPAVIIAALERPILALWAVLAIVGVRELENLLVGPRIIGSAVRVRPALIIILLVVAGYLWGLLGLVLVVPVTAVLRDIAYYLYLRTSLAGVLPDQALRQVRRARRRRVR